MRHKKILWLVTARSGSKSIPNKNIKLLGGHPLLSYRIKSALLTRFFNDVWVSTDSEIYAKISVEYGGIIPFLRPPILSNDDSSSIDVVLHAMNFASKNNFEYDYIGLLEPTSPFITCFQLEEALSILEANDTESAIVATRESRPNRIFIQKESKYLDEVSNNIKSITKLGRQEFKKEITPSGGFYISKWDEFLKNKSFYTEKTLSYLVDDISGLEIDNPIDWTFAEFIIEKQLFDKSKLFRQYER
jgi:CMP-N,N'-diacetyllegionaminic acid synthase